MSTKHCCVAAHCGYHFISCLIELQHIHTIEHYLLQKHLLHEPRGWGPAQCNILDPLCPSEPKEENLAGTILSFDYFIFFFWPAREKNQVHATLSKNKKKTKNNKMYCVLNVNYSYSSQLHHYLQLLRIQNQLC